MFYKEPDRYTIDSLRLNRYVTKREFLVVELNRRFKSVISIYLTGCLYEEIEISNGIRVFSIKQTLIHYIVM